MKKIFFPVTLFITIGLMSSCKKDNSTNPGTGNTGAYFFSNTEWTGVVGTYGQTYPQPCYLHFNNESTVTVYALFHMFRGTDELIMDSMVGNITAIDTVSDAQTRVYVDFPLTDDQQIYYFPDKKTLQGGSASATNAVSTTQFTTSAEIMPAVVPSVKGTVFNTNRMTSGPTEGMYEFPDISFIRFSTEGTSSYERNGKIITYTPPHQDQLLESVFAQHGPMVFFNGYNETADKMIAYFGVLSADGNTILADTRVSRLDARLPYYYQTIFWYGPPGVTPNTHKVH